MEEKEDGTKTSKDFVFSLPPLMSDGLPEIIDHESILIREEKVSYTLNVSIVEFQNPGSLILTNQRIICLPKKDTSVVCLSIQINSIQDINRNQNFLGISNDSITITLQNKDEIAKIMIIFQTSKTCHFYYHLLKDMIRQGFTNYYRTGFLKISQGISKTMENVWYLLSPSHFFFYDTTLSTLPGFYILSTVQTCRKVPSASKTLEMNFLGILDRSIVLSTETEEELEGIIETVCLSAVKSLMQIYYDTKTVSSLKNLSLTMSSLTSTKFGREPFFDTDGTFINILIEMLDSLDSKVVLSATEALANLLQDTRGISISLRSGEISHKLSLLLSSQNPRIVLMSCKSLSSISSFHHTSVNAVKDIIPQLIKLLEVNKDTLLHAYCVSTLVGLSYSSSARESILSHQKIYKFLGNALSHSQGNLNLLCRSSVSLITQLTTENLEAKKEFLSVGVLKSLVDILSLEISDSLCITDTSKAISNLTSIEEGVFSLLDINKSISIIIHRLSNQGPKNTINLLKTLLNISSVTRGKEELEKFKGLFDSISMNLMSTTELIVLYSVKIIANVPSCLMGKVEVTQSDFLNYLVDLLDSPLPELRLSVLKVLSSILEMEIVQATVSFHSQIPSALFKIMKENPESSKWALKSLAHLGSCEKGLSKLIESGDCLKLIEEFLSDQDIETKRYAIASINILSSWEDYRIRISGEAEILSKITDLLNSSDPKTGSSCAMILGRIWFLEPSSNLNLHVSLAVNTVEKLFEIVKQHEHNQLTIQHFAYPVRNITKVLSQTIKIPKAREVYERYNELLDFLCLFLSVKDSEINRNSCDIISSILDQIEENYDEKKLRSLCLLLLSEDYLSKIVPLLVNQLDSTDSLTTMHAVISLSKLSNSKYTHKFMLNLGSDNQFCGPIIVAKLSSQIASSYQEVRRSSSHALANLVRENNLQQHFIVSEEQLSGLVQLIEFQQDAATTSSAIYIISQISTLDQGRKILTAFPNLPSLIITVLEKFSSQSTTEHTEIIRHSLLALSGVVIVNSAAFDITIIKTIALYLSSPDLETARHASKTIASIASNNSNQKALLIEVPDVIHSALLLICYDDDDCQYNSSITISMLSDFSAGRKALLKEEKIFHQLLMDEVLNKTKCAFLSSVTIANLTSESAGLDMFIKRPELFYPLLSLTGSTHLATIRHALIVANNLCSREEGKKYAIENAFSKFMDEFCDQEVNSSSFLFQLRRVSNSSSLRFVQEVMTDERLIHKLCECLFVEELSVSQFASTSLANVCNIDSSVVILTKYKNTVSKLCQLLSLKDTLLTKTCSNILLLASEIPESHEQLLLNESIRNITSLVQEGNELIEGFCSGILLNLSFGEINSKKLSEEIISGNLISTLFHLIKNNNNESYKTNAWECFANILIYENVRKKYMEVDKNLQLFSKEFKLHVTSLIHQNKLLQICIRIVKYLVEDHSIISILVNQRDVLLNLCECVKVLSENIFLESTGRDKILYLGQDKIDDKSYIHIQNLLDSFLIVSIDQISAKIFLNIPDLLFSLSLLLGQVSYYPINVLKNENDKIIKILLQIVSNFLNSQESKKFSTNLLCYQEAIPVFSNFLISKTEQFCFLSLKIINSLSHLEEGCIKITLEEKKIADILIDLLDNQDLFFLSTSTLSCLSQHELSIECIQKSEKITKIPRIVIKSLDNISDQVIFEILNLLDVILISEDAKKDMVSQRNFKEIPFLLNKYSSMETKKRILKSIQKMLEHQDLREAFFEQVPDLSHQIAVYSNIEDEEIKLLSIKCLSYMSLEANFSGSILRDKKCMKFIQTHLVDFLHYLPFCYYAFETISNILVHEDPEKVLESLPNLFETSLSALSKYEKAQIFILNTLCKISPQIKVVESSTIDSNVATILVDLIEKGAEEYPAKSSFILFHMIQCYKWASELSSVKYVEVIEKAMLSKDSQLSIFACKIINVMLRHKLLKQDDSKVINPMIVTCCQLLGSENLETVDEILITLSHLTKSSSSNQIKFLGCKESIIRVAERLSQEFGLISSNSYLILSELLFFQSKMDNPMIRKEHEQAIGHLVSLIGSCDKLTNLCLSIILAVVARSQFVVSLLIGSSEFYNQIEKSADYKDVDSIILVSRVFTILLDSVEGKEYAESHESFVISFQKHVLNESMDLVAQSIEILAKTCENPTIQSSISNDPSVLSVIFESAFLPTSAKYSPVTVGNSLKILSLLVDVIQSNPKFGEIQFEKLFDYFSSSYYSLIIRESIHFLSCAVVTQTGFNNIQNFVKYTRENEPSKLKEKISRITFPLSSVDVETKRYAACFLDRICSSRILVENFFLIEEVILETIKLVHSSDKDVIAYSVSIFNNLSENESFIQKLISTDRAVLDLCRCLTFKEDNVVKNTTACLTILAQRNEEHVIEEFERAQIGRSLSAILLALNTKVSNRPSSTGSNESFISSDLTKQTILTNSLMILSYACTSSQVRSQIVISDVEEIIQKLVSMVPSSSIEDTNNCLKILTKISDHPDVMKIFLRHPKSISNVKMCFEKKYFRTWNNCIELLSVISSCPSGKTIVSKDENLIGILFAIYLSEENEENQEENQDFKNSIIIPILNMISTQSVFAKCVMDHVLVKRLVFNIKTSKEPVEASLKLLAEIIECIDEKILETPASDESFIHSVFQMTNTNQLHTIRMATKILAAICTLSTGKNRLVKLDKDHVLVKKFGDLIQLNDKITTQNCCNILGRIFSLLKLEDNGMVLCHLALNLFTSNEVETLRTSSFLLKEIVQNKGELPEVSQILKASIYVIRSNDVMTVRNIAETLSLLASSNKTMSITKFPEICQICTKLISQSKDHETCRSLVHVLSVSNFSSFLCSSLNENSKFVSKLVSLLSDEDEQVTHYCLKILSSICNSPQGIELVANSPNCISQVSKIIFSQNEEDKKKSLFIISKIYSLDPKKASTSNRTLVDEFFSIMSTGESEEVALCAKILSCMSATEELRDQISRKENNVALLVKFLNCGNVDVIKNILDILYLVCGSEIGRAALESNEELFIKNSIHLFCSNNKKIVKVCCLIFDKLVQKKSYCDALRASDLAFNQLIDLIGSEETCSQPSVRILCRLGPGELISEETCQNVKMTSLKDALNSIIQQLCQNDRNQKKLALGALSLVLNKFPKVKKDLLNDLTFMESCVDMLGSTDVELIHYICSTIVYLISFKQIQSILVFRPKAIQQLVANLKRPGLDVMTRRHSVEILSVLSNHWSQGVKGFMESDPQLESIFPCLGSVDLLTRVYSFKILANVSREGFGIQPLMDLHDKIANLPADYLDDSRIVGSLAEIEKNKNAHAAKFKPVEPL